MTNRTRALDLKVLQPKEFEELVYDLLVAEGFVDVEWRDGGADGGRDIVAISKETDGVGFQESRRWFCDAKSFSRGVGFDDIHSTLSNATTHEIDYLLIVAWPHLTPACKDSLDAWQNGNKPRFRIRRWEKKDLERLLLKHTNVLRSHLPSVWSQGLEMDAYLQEATAIFRDFQSRISVVWKNPDARPFTDILRFIPKGNHEYITAIDQSQKLTATERSFLSTLLRTRESLDSVLIGALNTPESTLLVAGRWSDHPEAELIIMVPREQAFLREAVGRVLATFEDAWAEGLKRGILAGSCSWKPFRQNDHIGVYALFRNSSSTSAEK